MIGNYTEEVLCCSRLRVTHRHWPGLLQPVMVPSTEHWTGASELLCDSSMLLLKFELICRSCNAGLKIMTIPQDSKYAIQQREIDKEFLWSKHNKVRISLQLLPSTREKEPRITR